MPGAVQAGLLPAQGMGPKEQIGRLPGMPPRFGEIRARPIL